MHIPSFINVPITNIMFNFSSLIISDGPTPLVVAWYDDDEIERIYTFWTLGNSDVDNIFENVLTFYFSIGKRKAFSYVLTQFFVVFVSKII
jgi:hypothetical protein